MSETRSVVIDEQFLSNNTLNNVIVHGWSLGTHIGFTNHIIGRWSFNVEGGIRMNTIPTHNVAGTILSDKQIAANAFGETSYYYPVSAGLRYNL